MSSFQDHVDYENVPTDASGRPLQQQRRSLGRKRSMISALLWAMILVMALTMGMVHFRKRLPENEKSVMASNAADSETHSVPKNDDGVHPQVAWMMSFGGSGTSYTITNTEHMTGVTTATNYARDIVPSVPVHQDWTNGPFVHATQLKLPEKYILTKTHCGGYCMDCAPQTYVYDQVTDFEHDCLTATSASVDSSSGEYAVRTSTYSNAIPKRAIHLIRDPFDNMVGRMHLAVKLSADRQGHGNDAPLKEFDNSMDGFYEWCDYLDTKYADAEASSTTINHAILEAFSDLPCHAEWYRYVQWHNLATEVRDQLELPVYHLFYENYTLAYDDTVEQVLEFLELEAVHSPIEFYVGKTYRSFFKPEHAQMAADFTKQFASPRVWELLEHYFHGISEGDDDTAVESEFDLKPADDDQVSTTVNGDNDDDSVVENVDGGAATVDKSSNEGSEVAWLLSFPNSGTSYTITNTERLSNYSTASNYASDWEKLVPVRSEFTKGPYLHNLNMKVPGLVLTKTHCTAYCADCSPETYVIGSVNEFQEGCRTVHAKVNGKEVDQMYSAAVPAKAVHLIRDPFDNIVARLHLSLKRMQEIGAPTDDLKSYTEGREGLLAWCKYIDEKYAEEEGATDLIRPKIKSLWKDVPCHAEWFRYVQWHNLALEMTSQMELPVLYLHYEKYGQHYNKVVSDLFKFLELTPVRDPIEFVAGKHYADYYTAEEQRAAARLVKAMASPDCWELIKSYFDGLLDE
ncbi:hypothetical protein MPSEU_000398200 [Mayamaea pseudoterrestris]|nr:hypothetical protein MPSEU_000398200 [Mayamaea pseudoterrestris]